MLDVHELAAGKLAALFSRTASRDLFDARELLTHGGLKRDRLRLGFVVYGGINRRDWRAVSLDDVQASPEDVDQRLIPMLRADVAPAREQIARWTQQLVADCRELLSVVLPLEASERQFLDALNDRGDIVPELVTDETPLQDLIRVHPGLLWKALNVKKHFGSLADETT
ncbi:MAG: nucleotidyl transferase AbiEii/AbiGii toxin family protein [Polyangiaceae bacterium]|nr:nucleotidyl transferase AbiEii/AbiGii toxin family protein [Polyangiaceae bacterium]